MENTEVNYVQAKKDFLMLADLLGQHSKYMDIYRFFRRDNIEKIIDLKLRNAGLARHDKYEVMNINGTNRLMERRNMPWIHAQCLSWEEMFGLFMPLHIESGHRDHHYLLRQIKQMCGSHGVEFKYPSIALPLFQKACNICALNNKKLRPVKVCSVHAIAMAQRKLVDKFRYLLIYSDLETYFTILRPLMEKSHQEISTELYKIFMQFGPPNIVLMHGYNPKLSENVEICLSELCPSFKIHVKHRPVKYGLPTIVTERIDAWMERTKKSQWEVGCFIVQAELNNSHMVKPELKQLDITPYDIQFHTKTFDKTFLENDVETCSNNAPKNQPKDSRTKKDAPKKVGGTQSDLAKSSGLNNGIQSVTNSLYKPIKSSNNTFLDAYLTQLATREENEEELSKELGKIGRKYRTPMSEIRRSKTNNKRINPQIPTIKPQITSVNPPMPSVNLHMPLINTQIPTIMSQIPSINPQVPTISILIPTVNPHIPTTEPQIPTINIQIPTTNIQIPTTNPQTPTRNLQNSGNEKTMWW